MNRLGCIGTMALLTCMLCLQVLPVRAENPDILLILEHDNTPAIQAAQLIEQYLEEQGKPLRVAPVNQLQRKPQKFGNPAIVITLGRTALKSALAQRNNQPIYAAMVTRSGLQNSLQTVKNTADIHALLLEQPYRRYYLLASLVVPNSSTAGTPLGPYLANKRALLSSAASEAGFTLASVQITEDSNPVRTLAPLVTESEVIVLLPDKIQVHRQAARWLLELGYRDRTPLVAFSQRYTEIGATASLHTAIKDVARDLVDMLERDDSSTEVDIHSPSRFTVTTNRSIARKLKIPLKDDEWYEAEIRRLEAGLE